MRMELKNLDSRVSNLQKHVDELASSEKKLAGAENMTKKEQDGSYSVRSDAVWAAQQSRRPFSRAAASCGEQGPQGRDAASPQPPSLETPCADDCAREVAWGSGDIALPFCACRACACRACAHTTRICTHML